MRPNSDFFTYTVPFLALAGGASATSTIQFDAASNFDWMYSTYDADVAAGAVTVSTRVYPLVNVLITPTDSTAQLMNASVPVVSMFGNGESPFILPAARVVPARSALTFLVTNRTAGTTYNLYLNLIGVKKYLR